MCTLHYQSQLSLRVLRQVNTETHDEYVCAASGYPAQMDKFSTYLGLQLSHVIFAGTEQLSSTLQGKDTTAADLSIRFLVRERIYILLWELS